jgi:U3 small nucleolar RNA-associated protein 20
VRCAAVAAIALERLWQHTRRGTTDAIWEALAAATERRLAAAEAAAAAAPAAEPEATKGSRKTRRQSDQGQPEPGSQQQQQQDLQACVAHAARAVLLVAHGVHFFRGSRVEDYKPLCTLADRLVSLLQQLPPAAAAAATDSSEAAAQVQLQWRQSSPSEPISWTADELAGLTLSHSTLQLILGITLGHTKEVGASKGLGVLKVPAQRWSRVLGCVPQRELLAFTQGCVLPPSSAATAELFAPQLLGALGQLLLAAPGADGSSSSDGGADLALAGLMEVCGLLRPAAAVGSNDLPLLLTAQPGGTDVAAAVQRLAAGCSSSLSGIGSRHQLLVSWAALQLLPHAAVEPRQALEVCSAVVAAATAAATTAAASSHSDAAGQRGKAVSSSDLLQLRGLAAGMLAALLPAIAPQQLPQQAAKALQWIVTAPGSSDNSSRRLDLSTVSAAAMLAEALRSYVDSAGKAHSSDGSSDAESAATAAAVATGRALLSSEQLPAFATALLPCLVQPQQSLRAAALRLLCCFDQPAFLGHHQQQAQQEQERAAFEGMACDVLCVLRDMHTQPCSIQAGRTWAVALGGSQTCC